MFILRMIFRSFSRQFRRRLLVAITICLSSAVATAMLGVVFDVGDKLNEELSAYGSNIVIEPKSDAVVADLYETVDGSDTEPTSFLKESDIQKIKTIFWAYNITNFAPKLNLHADITAGAGGDTATVPVVGTWFNTTLHLATGETSVVGVQGMRSWWTINGRWARDDADEAMIGADLADQLHIDAPGMTITLSRGNAAATVTVVGIYDSGDEENGAVYVPSATLQELSGLTGSVDEVEVKALTTPENDLARKVSRNPAAVTQEEWETWYCTAYASSIAYQIEEVLPDAVAKQIRQISELQGDVLNKTRAVMIVMTGLSLLAAAIAVANLMAASITERSSELALLKAIGATDGAVSRLMLLETAVIALIGALAGAGLGVGAAQLIGQVVVASMVGTVTLFGLAAICLTVPQQMGDEMRAYGANLIVTGPQGGMDDDVVRTVETQVRAAAEADAATYRYETVRVNAASYVLAGITVDATRAQPALGRRRRLAERWAGIGRFGCGRSDEPADRRHRDHRIPRGQCGRSRRRRRRNLVGGFLGQRRGADEGRPCVHRHPGNRRRRVSRGRNPGNRRQRGRHHLRDRGRHHRVSGFAQPRFGDVGRAATGGLERRAAGRRTDRQSRRTQRAHCARPVPPAA